MVTQNKHNGGICTLVVPQEEILFLKTRFLTPFKALTKPFSKSAENTLICSHEHAIKKSAADIKPILSSHVESVVLMSRSKRNIKV